jgi:hypothetical protein
VCESPDTAPRGLLPCAVRDRPLCSARLPQRRENPPVPALAHLRHQVVVCGPQAREIFHAEPPQQRELLEVGNHVIVVRPVQAQRAHCRRIVALCGFQGRAGRRAVRGGLLGTAGRSRRFRGVMVVPVLMLIKCFFFFFFLLNRFFFFFFLENFKNTIVHYPIGC